MNCLDPLTELDGEIEELLNILGESPSRLRRAQIEDARNRLARLMSKLKEHYHRLTTKPVTQEEQFYCRPAIQEAYTGISVKTNSSPSYKWGEELIDAQISIRYYLRQLRVKN